MNTWIVPSNDHIYLITDSLNKNSGLVDWRQTRQFAVGDIVYIYKTKPEQCIRYKMEVVAIDITDEGTLDDEAFWNDKDTYYSGLGRNLYVRFRLITEYDDERLSFTNLRAHGVKNNIQSTMQIHGEIVDYLHDIDTNQFTESYTTDYPEEDKTLYEGTLIKVNVNRYERNRDARQKCLKKNGYSCAVCGMNFESIYGEVGHHFIEVHHKVPISSIGENYKIDEENDLVPVCSNCHSMLHQKQGKYDVFTIDELKEMIAEAKKKSSEEQPPLFLGTIDNVEDYPVIKKFIDTYLSFHDDKQYHFLTSECINEFGMRYPNMKPKDWDKAIREYLLRQGLIRGKEDEPVLWNVAEKRN